MLFLLFAWLEPGVSAPCHHWPALLPVAWMRRVALFTTGCVAEAYVLHSVLATTVRMLPPHVTPPC